LSRLVRRRHAGGGWIWVEDGPEHCPAGHELAPNRVLVSWLPCSCTPSAGGHRVWTCRTILTDGTECDTAIHDPPHTPPEQTLTVPHPFGRPQP
jgi:hypothetical protein